MQLKIRVNLYIYTKSARSIHMSFEAHFYTSGTAQINVKVAPWGYSVCVAMVNANASILLAVAVLSYRTIGKTLVHSAQFPRETIVTSASLTRDKILASMLRAVKLALDITTTLIALDIISIDTQSS